MRSGIGPAAHLRQHGIDTVVDLPGVGQNLQDHLLFGVGYQSLRDLPVPALLAEAGMFLHTGPASADASPDLQFFFGPIQFVAERYRIDGPGFTFAPILTQPRSRGTVTLRSADRRRTCRSSTRTTCRTNADLEVLLRGIEIARELAHTKAFAGLRGRELAPGDAVTDPEALGAVRAGQRDDGVAPGRHLPDGQRPRTPSSTPGCACTGWTGCASPTHRSCPRSPAATPTPRPS